MFVCKAWYRHVAGPRTHCGASFRVSSEFSFGCQPPKSQLPQQPRLACPKLQISGKSSASAPLWVWKESTNSWIAEWRDYMVHCPLSQVCVCSKWLWLDGSFRTSWEVWSVNLLWWMGLEQIKRKHVKISPTGSSCEYPFTWLVSSYFCSWHSPQNFFANSVSLIFIAFIFNTPIGTFYKIDHPY